MAQNDFENKRDSADQKIDLRLWKRLIAYAMRHRRTVVSVMLVLLVVAGIDLAYPQFSRYAIDHFIEGGTTEGLWLYGLVYAALVVVQSLGVFLFVRGAGRLEMDMSYDIRQDAFAKLQQLSFSFYDTTSVGWLMARMVSDIARLSDMIAWSLVDLMWAGVFAVGIVAVLLAMNWKLGLLVLCITPVLAALCVFFQKRILKYQRAVRKTNSRITGAFNEGIMGAMTTKTLVREEASAAEFRELTGAMRTASIRSALLSALFMPLVMALGSICTALALSRGGSLVFAWMTMTGEENPFYERFDEILDICREYDVTISLGDACRPGCLADASDVCQIEELVRLGELTKRAWEKDVQVMVEGPGHMPIDQIAANMKLQQTICQGAPFYVLGPIVTDIAPGYDHITSAIGGAIAASAGAAFLCYVTPAEHLALPNVEDVKQGIIAARIAAHAADIAKKVPHARDLDDAMADARRTFDWEKQWECSIDPETARAIRESRAPEHEDSCSMCGKFCAVRSMNKALSGEYIDIL